MSDDWQPIETAPRDGTWVLLYFYQPHGSSWIESGYAIGFWATDGSHDWYDSEASSKSLTEFGDKPTHWAPLKPPASTLQPENRSKP